MKDPKPVRRTQAERSAAMRERILKATIHNLHVHGYAATTTLLVAKQAKVSRGAMLHHFPTKVELMLFVVQAVYEDEIALYRERLAAIDDLEQRQKMLPMIVWDVLSRPAGVAVLEVLQGSRSDPVLAKQLAPLQAQIERDSIQRIEQSQLLPGPHPNLAMVRLIVWAMRGLSIANVLVRKPAEIAQSVELLGDMMRGYYAAAPAHPAEAAPAKPATTKKRAVAAQRKGKA